MNKATLGGGCFWCIEAVFKRIDGVRKVRSGYAGGSIENPSYEKVCTGLTNHAEVVQINYDENLISFEDLLDIFFEIHNPETKDKEGPDIGSQYRSIVLCHNKSQRKDVEDKIKELESSGRYNDIVTEVKELSAFYEAVDKHQDYYERNETSGYCNMYIPPKISKVRDKYSGLVSGEDN